MLAVAACTTTLQQESSDGVTGRFEGKVMRSTHASVAEGSRCSGTLRREANSPTAKVTVKCGDRTMYTGTGRFTISVGDPTRRDDDKASFDDALTSDKDGTPAVHLTGENNRPDGSGGSLTLWDAGTAQAAGYEIAIVL